MMTLAPGWSDAGLVEQGSFDLEEVRHMGEPDTLQIRARSADLRGSRKVTHCLGDGDFTTRLEAELYGSDASAGQAQDVGPGDSED